MNSRQKGKRGELEFAEVLRSYGHMARRGVQFQGGVDSPDVVCSTLPGVHFEVKRTERTDLYGWMDQAITDAGPGKLPVVTHRKNGGCWLAVLRFKDLMELLNATHRGAESQNPRVEGPTPGGSQCAGKSPTLEEARLQTGSDAGLQRDKTE